MLYLVGSPDDKFSDCVRFIFSYQYSFPVLVVPECHFRVNFTPKIDIFNLYGLWLHTGSVFQKLVDFI